jgi:hypothetical protein
MHIRSDRGIRRSTAVSVRATGHADADKYFNSTASFFSKKLTIV